MPRPAAIAVTGATGAIGGMVARRLSRKGVQQRLVVRDAARAPALPGSEVVEASYDDIEAMRAGVSDVDTLFLVSAPESPDRVRRHANAIEAAAAAGVRRVVYLSFMSAASDATYLFARDHFHTEQQIRATRMRHTFLRPALYSQLVPDMCSLEGVIRGPAGAGRVAWVTREDVADAAVGALTGEGHDGSTYDLSGPGALTFAETAGALAEITGREISFEEETLEGARASRAGSAPGWRIEGWVTSYAAAAAGEFATVSGAVKNLTGSEPQSLLSFLRTHPETYQHLLIARYRQH